MRLLLLLPLLAAAVASPNPHVAVLKCCPYGETLDPHTADGPPACMRTDNLASSSRWTPKIFSKRLRNFLGADAPLPAHWTVHAASRPPCGDRAVMVLAHPQNHPVFVLFEEGSLFLHETNEMLPAGRFCVDATAALVCPAKDDDAPATSAASSAAAPNSIDGGGPIKKSHKPQVRKCCQDNAVFDEQQMACALRPASSPSADLWAVAGERYRDAFAVIRGFPKCDRDRPFVIRGHIGGGPSAANITEAHLEDDGRVRLGAGAPLHFEEYCLETLLDAGGVRVLACLASGEVPEQRASDPRFTLYPALLFLSVFFLAATLLASCLLPAAYHQLHWRCQTNYVASLMLGDLFLAVTQVSGDALQGPFCIIFAILMHFLFLAAFFWLNTMCFNIWWTFRDLRPASVDKNQEVVRMRLYEAYAWGGPLVIAGVAAALDHLPADEYPHLLRPGFGQNKCWFRGDSEVLPYFFGPLGILLLINLCLFILTARELTCGLWKADGAKPTTERATLRRVCLKLVVVMGVTWVVDVVSWVAGGPKEVWYAVDAVNALQGVLIFAVVGCQPHVWTAVKRLWCLRESRWSRSEASRRALHLSSTSQGPPSMGPDSLTTTTTSNGTPAKLQLNGNGVNGNGVPPPPNSETPC
ncbi:probable G-protein coupled receptor Mth-like 1 [Thrips palmi]|uniref:Probable G-protein coupled receptor Mth-like 1 n=1 Tax=Thrips palmi TaxID=161013 RepID=A0A6P8Y4L9_THRPL|nr:probable G-protein coupled receptor Mth-like 1 [Thrips palmi]